MTMKEAEVLALKVLKQVMEEKLTSTNIEVASVTPERGYAVYSEEQLKVIVDAL